MGAELNARVERAPIIREELTALEQAEEVLKENYLDTFKRVVALHTKGYTLQRAAYLLKISHALAEGYMNIWNTHRHEALPFRIHEVEEALEASRCEVKKKTGRAS